MDLSGTVVQTHTNVVGMLRLLNHTVGRAKMLDLRLRHLRLKQCYFGYQVQPPSRS